MEYVICATSTAKEAGKKLLVARDAGFETQFKGGNPKDIVTSVDIEVNAYIVGEIRKNFPDHSIYSEEGEGLVRDSEYQWVIDPIDGSSNFSRGIPHFAVCIGLLHNGESIMGVVYNPVTQELFHFTKGGGAFLNNQPIHVSSITDPKDAFAFFHAGRKDEVREWGGESYKKLLGTVKKTSNLGSSSLDACFVAAGRIEVNVYGTLTTIDIASALGILKEAGGVISDALGNDLVLSKESQRIYMANNKQILTTIRTLLES